MCTTLLEISHIFQNTRLGYDIASGPIFPEYYSVKSCLTCGNLLQCELKNQICTKLDIYMGQGSLERKINELLIDTGHFNSELVNINKCCWKYRNHNIKEKGNIMGGRSRIVICRLFWGFVTAKTPYESVMIPKKITINRTPYYLRSLAIKTCTDTYYQSYYSVISFYNGKWYWFQEGHIIGGLDDLPGHIKRDTCIRYLLYEK